MTQPSSTATVSSRKLTLRVAQASLLLGVAIAVAPGCAFLRDVVGLGPQSPKVSLVEVTVENFTLTALDLMVVVRVDNPNDFDLNFAKLRYKLTVDNLEIASGDYVDRLSIPSTGNAMIKLPLRVDAQSAMKLAHDLLGNAGESVAVMTATADFLSPIGAMEVNFEDKRPLKKLAGF